MATRLEREYETELAFIRQYAKEFAAERPGIAGRLVLSEDTGVPFHQHGMSVLSQFPDTGRGQTDPVLMCLYFPGYPYLHGDLLIQTIP